MRAKSHVVAESPDGKNWVGIEASDGGFTYISAKHDNNAQWVMTFNPDGSTRFMSNIGVNGAVISEAWGNAFSTIGGNIRSNNSSVMSLDGKTFSFVTSPADAHLCQNSYWDGVTWHKYDVSRRSAHLYVSDGRVGIKSSDAGEPDANQRNDYIYHTGYRPSPADIGAAVATEVYSKTYVDEKGWMRVEDLRG